MRFLHHPTAPPLLVEVADTEAKRTQGLLGRTELGTNQGMLFVFDRPGLYSFSMRGMQIPLDLIMLYSDGTVVGRMHMAVGATCLYRGDVPYKYAVEVPWNWTTKHRIFSGDRFEFGKEL